MVPDQHGRLWTVGELSYPPRQIVDGSRPALECWAAYAGRPTAWLHHDVLTRNRITRLSAINRLVPPRWDGDANQRVPETSIAEWLEALVEGKAGDDAVTASGAAIQAAANVQNSVASGAQLGQIVLAATGEWLTADRERVFLPLAKVDDAVASDVSLRFVHPALVAERGVLSALRTLGIKSLSPESAFRLVASKVLQGASAEESALHGDFWVASRELSADAAMDVIREVRDWRGASDVAPQAPSKDTGWGLATHMSCTVPGADCIDGRTRATKALS